MAVARSDSSSDGRYDVIIIGGGMVGLSLAIALAQSETRVLVIDREDLNAQTLPAYDGRVSAISLGSERVLRAIGAWDALAGVAEPILDIRVADEDSGAYVHYHYRDLADSPMGHMIENRHIRTALLARARALPSLTLTAPAQMECLQRTPFGVHLRLNDGSEYTASLAVAADGKRSKLREEAGIETLQTSYGQIAIVVTVEHEKPHEGLALERFLPAGPFAALPMKGNRSALVWTETEETAPRLLALPEAEFVAEIRSRLGDYLGELKTIGKRFSYPLHLVLATRYVDTRLALVGDAAHAIHPIAGQGVNVGFRDVAVLSELICEARLLGLDIGSSTLLERYQRWRRFDAMTMGAITDFINRLFSTDRTTLRVARRAGLASVNRLPPLKRLFMRHAMGLLGDLPPMMRDAG